MPYGTASAATITALDAMIDDGLIVEPDLDKITTIDVNLWELRGIFEGSLEETFYFISDVPIKVAQAVAPTYANEHAKNVEIVPSVAHLGWSIEVSRAVVFFDHGQLGIEDSDESDLFVSINSGNFLPTKEA